MSLEIYNMTDYDLSLIKDILISDYDDFWTYDILKDELKNSSSEYFVAKLDNNILGFAGIWKSVDDVHITDIVVNTVFHIFREICDHARFRGSQFQFDFFYRFAFRTSYMVVAPGFFPVFRF